MAPTENKHTKPLFCRLAVINAYLMLFWVVSSVAIKGLEGPGPGALLMTAVLLAVSIWLERTDA